MTIGGIQDNVKYTFTAADGSVATFNDPTDTNYCGMIRFTGLDDAEVRETADDRTTADGGIHGDFWRGRRPVVGNVEFVPSSTTDRNTKYDKIMRAIGNSLRTDTTISWTPDGSASQFIKVRKNGRIARSEDPGWLTRFQIPMVAADPLKYSTVLNSSSSSPVTNAGNVTTYPVITSTWDGSSGEIVATKTATGEAVSLTPGLTYQYTAQYATGTLPSGVCVDSSGNMYIPRYNANVVEKRSSTGTLLATLGSTGSGNGQFNGPIKTKIASDGNLLVVDRNNARISKWNTSTNAWMSNIGVGVLTAPWALAVDSVGNIYVSDTSWKGIRVFNSAGVHGTDFGDTFTSCQGMEFRAGDILVVAPNANVVSEYKNVTTGGTWVGNVDTGFYDIADIAIDANSNLFILDSGWEPAGPSAGSLNTIWAYQFDAPGSTSDYTYAAAFGTAGSGNGEFDGALGMAYGNGGLLVADTLNNRIEKFSLGNVSIDMFARTAYVGGTNAYGSLGLSPQWWGLDPGSNAFTVTGASAFTISWRDAWQ